MKDNNNNPLQKILDNLKPTNTDTVKIAADPSNSKYATDVLKAMGGFNKSQGK